MKKFFPMLLLLIVMCLAFAAASAEETVLADNTQCLVRVNRMEQAGDTFTMELYVENKSSVAAMFSLSGTAVNGYVVNAQWSMELVPGDSCEDVVLLEDLSQQGITDDVSILSFDFRVYNAEAVTADNFLLERFTLYPLGEDKAAVQERKQRNKDIEVFVNEDVTCLITEFGKDPQWGYKMTAWLENKSDETVVFTVDDVKVNGILMDPYWVCEIPPKTRAFSDLCWSHTDFEESGIQEVEELDLLFRVLGSSEETSILSYKKNIVIWPE